MSSTFALHLDVINLLSVLPRAHPILCLFQATTVMMFTGREGSMETLRISQGAKMGPKQYAVKMIAGRQFGEARERVSWLSLRQLTRG